MAHKSRMLIIAVGAILLVAALLVTGLPYGHFGSVNGAWAQTYPGSVVGPGCNQYSDLGFTTSVQDPVGGTFEGGFLMCGYSSVTFDTQNVLGLACDALRIYRVAERGTQELYPSPLNGPTCVKGQLILNALAYPVQEFRIYSFKTPPTIPQGDALLHSQP